MNKLSGEINVYTDTALVIIASLGQKEAKILHFMLKERNEYNIVKSSMISISRKNKLSGNRQYFSKVIKKMIGLNIIQKVENKIWINPYLFQPYYIEKDYTQYKTQ